MRLHTAHKAILSGVLGLLAFARLSLDEALRARMDATFLILAVAALIIWVIPWEQLRSLKAAGVEVTLEQPQVKAALSGLGLERIADVRLRQRLQSLTRELSAVAGSRVLWIDDRPLNVSGERRLLRALGAHVVVATSSDEAEEILETDNDFDLIVSDIQRRGESYKEVQQGVDIHEGVNYVVKLRGEKDSVISNLPVIFYAAYPWESLVEFTRPARETLPEPEISNSAADFLPKAVRLLAEERARPIVYGEQKKPTRI